MWRYGPHLGLVHVRFFGELRCWLPRVGIWPSWGRKGQRRLLWDDLAIQVRVIMHPLATEAVQGDRFAVVGDVELRRWIKNSKGDVQGQ